ncbi:MAG: phage portal protein [Pseudoxanthomonas sp.]
MHIVERLRGLFGQKAAANMAPVTNVGGGPGGWRQITEPFTGAWQRGVSELTHGDVTQYSTVYACLSRISKDVGKLPFQLKELDSKGLWREARSAFFSPVLRLQNHYQTPAQFRENWILSKLQYGNTYVLKRRNERGFVDGLYILDPTKVTPMVSASGTVFYQISYGTTNTIIPGIGAEQVTVPAREIIHDREIAIHHPLIGVPPLWAAHLSATKNIRIQKNEASFFENGARLSGVLTMPAGISDKDAEKLKEYWRENFTGQNTGRVAVIGADAKYLALAGNAQNSQLVEQLKYSDEQICHAFGIPPFKVGIGSIPAGLKVDDLNQMYYSDALQSRIESMEDCLDEGLGLQEGLCVELNLEPLLRMDAQKQAEVEGTLVKNGIKAPNEARRRFGLDPLQGGDSVYLQQQNYSLEPLAKRDQSDDPFGTGKPEKSADRSFAANSDPQKEKMRARFNIDTKAWEMDPSDWRYKNPEKQLAWESHLYRKQREAA